MEDQTIYNGEDDRFGEYGVVGAIQKDESRLDSRYCIENDDHDDGRVEGETKDDDDKRLSQRGRIPFSTKKLYGRERELEQLTGLFKKVLEQSPIQNDDENGTERENDDVLNSTNHSLAITKVVFVSGFSGSGKSALVKHFVDNVQKSGRRLTGSKCHEQVLFLQAKYEKTQNPTPFSAFATLFDQIPLSLTKEFRHVYQSLQDSLGDDVDVLQKIFPQLRHLFHEQSTTSISHPDEKSISSSQHSLPGYGKMFDRQQSRICNKARLKFAISALFRALCDHLDNRPLILYVDDLQWADLPGLELLQSLSLDSSLQYLFFIGAYRSNEIQNNEQLGKIIKAIEGKVPCKTFHLNEISQRATGEFIADSLGLSIGEVEPLTKAVFAKSLGNPLYTRQALEFLARRNALYYDNMVFAWSWNLCDEVDVNNTGTTSKYLEDLLTDDILEMVKSKIDHMTNQDLKRVVATASLVRSSFDVDTLLEVMMTVESGCMLWQQEMPHHENSNDEGRHTMDKKKLVDLLDLAVAEGLLLRVPVSARREYATKDDNPTFAFSHDRVQEAAVLSLSVEKNGCVFQQLGT
jgi:predicted ATPase